MMRLWLLDSRDHSAIGKHATIAILLLFFSSMAIAAPAISGLASWYGPGFIGNLDASGCRFNSTEMTAASRTLPIGARVFIRNRRNGRSAIVQITDRGPYLRGRIIDVSHAVATKLDMVGNGVVMVDMHVLQLPAEPHRYGVCIND